MFTNVVMDMLVALGIVVLVKNALPKPKEINPIIVNRIAPYYRPTRN